MRSINKTNVCVVGGAGFLGSHLVDHLVTDRGCRVTVLDNLCVGKREYVHPKAMFIHHDVTGSEEFMRTVFERYKIQYVLNYAAWPYIPDSFDRPLQTFSVNATGAIKVINAADAAGCEAVLQVSSAELYGGPNTDSPEPQEALTENSPVAPHSTYGAAKAAVDYYCQAAWKERKVPVIVLRQFNCIGERDCLHPYVIPEIARQIASGSTIVRLGNNSSRDFLYAGDAVRMTTELLEKGSFGEVYNLGSQESIKIYNLARLVGELMGKSCTVVQDKTRCRPWEIWHLRSNNTKIYSAIESRPIVSLQDALQRTLKYFESIGWSFPW